MLNDPAYWVKAEPPVWGTGIQFQPSRYGTMAGAMRTVQPWQDFLPSLDFTGSPKSDVPSKWAPSCVLFMHERTAAGRPPRLVVIRLDDWALIAHVIRPAGFWGSVAVIRSHEVDSEFGAMIRAADSWREPTASDPVFAGQIDPADPSRFTLRATVHGIDVKANGQLMPDDTIHVDIPNAEGLHAKITEASRRIPSGR
jgi:hypothetical protein